MKQIDFASVNMLYLDSAAWRVAYNSTLGSSLHDPFRALAEPWEDVMKPMTLAAVCSITLLASTVSAASSFERIDRTASDAAFLTVQEAATERAQKLQADLAPGAAQSWQVDLNLDALTRIEGQDGQRANARRGAPLSGHHLDLDIPERGMPLRLRFDTVYEGFGGVITYAGIIEGDEGSLVAISVDGDEIFGKIHHSEGYTYLLESKHHGDDYILSVIDQTLIP